MKRILLDIPFVEMSTQFNQSGEIEKHVLTPFGGLDITYRSVPGGENGARPVTLQVNAEFTDWAGDEMTGDVFKESLLTFVCEIAKKCIRPMAFDQFSLSVHMRGSSLNMCVPSTTSNSDMALAFS